LCLGREEGRHSTPSATFPQRDSKRTSSLTTSLPGQNSPFLKDREPKLEALNPTLPEAHA